ncbi:MAG TPA: hypothetical protein VGM90_14140 [Kofleriaceae bacterium]|jgi:hypothetical protein
MRSRVVITDVVDDESSKSTHQLPSLNLHHMPPISDGNTASKDFRLTTESNRDPEVCRASHDDSPRSFKVPRIRQFDHRMARSDAAFDKRRVAVIGLDRATTSKSTHIEKPETMTAMDQPRPPATE